MNRYRLRLVSVVVVGLLAAGCGGSAPAGKAKGAPKAGGPVNVLYAASLENIMNSTIGPAFGKGSGATFTGFPGDSGTLANNIKGKVSAGDVFVSASPSKDQVLQGPANGNWVSWYATLGAAPLVLGYNPNGKFAHDLTSGKPWYDVIDQPGFRVGRTDPATDPKGQLTVTALQQAQSQNQAAGLGAVLSSRSNVFSENDLVGNLQSGQLDAGFFYSSEAKAANLKTISLAPLNLSAGYTITVLNGAPHPAAAAAFVKFLYSPAGQKILTDAGIQVARPPVLTGPASGVPAELRPVFGA